MNKIPSDELDMKIRKVVVRLFEDVRQNNDCQKASLGSNLAPEKTVVGLKFLSRKFKEFIGLLVLYHYYPMEKSVLVYYHIDLEDMLKESESYWLSVLLQDKTYFLQWLQEQVSIEEQVLFSGIVTEKYLKSLLNSVVFRFEEKLKRPRKLVRRKGYRDKGSLGPLSSRTLKQECRNDFYLTACQFLREEKEFNRQTNSRMLLEHFTEGRVLSDELKIEFRFLSIGGKSHEPDCRKSSEEAYCQQRANEQTLRQERADRKAAEATRTKSSKPRKCFVEPSRITREGKILGEEESPLNWIE
jgi:hypothetical protein